MDRPTDKQIADVLAGLASKEDAKKVVRWFATDAGAAYLSESFDQDYPTRYLPRKSGYGLRGRFTGIMYAVCFSVRRQYCFRSFYC